jgi:hypothetical protein
MVIKYEFFGCEIYALLHKFKVKLLLDFKNNYLKKKSSCGNVKDTVGTTLSI